MAWQHENQMPYNMPLKVHINPNFRGKLTVPGAQGHGVRPSGIHFNPHWKPKVEGTDIINQTTPSTDHGDYRLQNPSQRRTIHINPKVIPNGVPQSISTFLQQEHLSAQLIPIPIAVHDSSARLIPPVNQWSNEERTAPTTCTNQNITVVKSLPKLNPTSNNSAQLFKYKKNIVSANSPAIRTAKIVCSKYKYLSSALQHQLLQHTQLSSRNTVPTTSTSCSRFKYVKKVENPPTISNVKSPFKSRIVSRFRLVKRNVPSESTRKVTSTAQSLTPRRLKVQKIPEGFKNIPDHTVKSRYKLLKKTDAPVQIRDLKNRTVMNTLKLKSTSGSRYKFVRQTPPNQRLSLKRKSPRAVKSRYKIVRGGVTLTPKSTRYRLIRNVHGTTRDKLRTPQRLSTSPFVRRNRWVNSRLDLQATKVIATSRKLLRIGRKPDSRPNKTNKRRKAKLLNIGGVFYRSTRTTLTRSMSVAAPTSIGNTKPYAPKGQILSIRGSRFVLDKSGKTLRRLTTNKLPVFRIHIGGVTFVPSSDNTLVRSQVHEARHRVSQAKQRSIAVLTSKLRKNNQPCLIYQRLGKCRLFENGRCPKVHDPKKVAICNDFVNGKCLQSAAECRLSHDVGPEKMPTCHFFLDGCCVRDPCPYSHVKLNKKAAICRDFLSGYCSAGDKCKKRHVFLCPEFEESKGCSKGKYCIYRHAGEALSRTRTPRVREGDRRSARPGVRPPEVRTPDVRAQESTAKNPEGPTTSKPLADSHTRYYVADKKENGCLPEELEANECSPEAKEEPVVLLPERTKLGELPGFIPL